MTAKRTSPGEAASAVSADAEPVPELELAEPAPPADPGDDAPDDMPEAASAAGDAADAGEAEDADVAAESAGDDHALASAEEAPDGDAEETNDAEDGEETPEGGDGDDASAAETLIRLHRRARHEETDELLAWLLAAPAGAPLTIDASEVENPSTPYVLAIVAAARARADAGSPAVVTSPSPAFVDAFSDLGLFGDLMKMEIRA